jgi:hypothetical protein
MCPPREQERGIDTSTTYEIQLWGRLDRDWSEWFEGMDISHEGEKTTLRGKLRDESALRGILTKIWDLNRTVVSVKRIERV